ncbi:hypothetical protein ACX35B_002540 [Enterococcus faecalis]|nr:hypothetical protein [Enterococcus faecalis]ELS0455730.1 hypothetical protein [Enterococcus faecalis]MCU9790804.1 hypothetical protein [Enterococcus faecalis]
MNLTKIKSLWLWYIQNPSATDGKYNYYQLKKYAKPEETGNYSINWEKKRQMISSKK